MLQSWRRNSTHLIVYRRQEEAKNIQIQVLVASVKKKKKKKKASLVTISEAHGFLPASLLIWALILDQRRRKCYRGGKKSSVNKCSAGLQVAVAAY